MGASRYGVWYDLDASPYSVYRHGMEFKFSSSTHADRFRLLVSEREEKMGRELARRVGCKSVDMDIPACIQLYRQLETRGFLILIGEERVTCAGHLRLSGLDARSIGCPQQSALTTGQSELLG